MNAGRWAQVKQLFQAALDLPSADRSAFVRAQSEGDDELRREVESLLASEEASGDFLSEIAAEYVPGAVDENLGRRIGPWRIEREIGAGGMGAVYLAEREGEFRQQAALKLMHRGMDSRAVVARFRYERQILAGLDHPNIARLLDGGATDDGRPYFVMEHVAGVPIDEFCRGLDIPERLGVFLHVCAAVQYAHQNLIVHRDLKPGNILVTPDGVPKLLDFGIAKLLRADTDDGANLTQVGFRALTPAYASPEQIDGRHITTATDIYSLGVILRELLTGQPQSRPTLKGDLHVIVLKATESEPQRRYASVEQFAGDIRRHLEGLPIVARPQTWRYRTGRFVRRNRVPVVAAALVVLSLAVGLIVARQERARAERNFADLRRLTQSFLFDFHDKIKDLPGSTDARNAVLQTALEYLRRLSAEARGNTGVARDVAEAWLRLGDVQGNPYGVNRGDLEAALASYREALAISAGPIYLARAHRSIGELLPQQGNAAAAVPHFRAAIAALATASDPEGRRELARSYESLGDVLGNTGIVNLSDAAGARDAYGKSLAIHESLGAQRGVAVIRMKLGDLALDAGDAATALKEFQATASVLREPREAGMVHRKIGGAYEALGRTREASAEYRRSSEIARERTLADPESTQARMDYAVSLKDRADLEQKAENWTAALPLYREILNIVGPISAARPDNVMLKSRHAEMLLNVGGLLAKLRRPDEGSRLYADGLRILKALADSPTATRGDRATYAEYLKQNPFEK